MRKKVVIMKEITYGTAVQISPNVRRITVPNPGRMTGPGTNTYIVGTDNIAIIDPGPVEPSHIKAILEIVGDRLKWILVTHTHPDHSPGAKVLADATGATLMGNVLATDDGHQDNSFVPQKNFTHDFVLDGGDFHIRAICTPGHVDNHLCFLVEEDQLLVTGDHIMQGSTVVIIPPHGDMKAYIESLRLLQNYNISHLAPGHGTLMSNPSAEIEGLIQHRLGRESKVVQTMKGLGYISLDDLTPKVYEDVDKSLHPLARYSLWAHILKLEKDQRVSQKDDLWCLVEA